METFPHKIHNIFCLLFYILPLDYRYGSLKHFGNGKVWVSTDNQVHDAPLSQLHNTEYVHVRIRMLKVENFEI